MIEVIKANRLTCEKCGHVWISETEPDRCAKCKRWNWNTTNKEKTNVDVRGTGSDATGGNGRSRDGATLPILPKATRKPVKLHPVQPMRGELVAGGGHQPGPTDEPHKGHRVYKSGDGRYCGDCKVNF